MSLDAHACLPSGFPSRNITTKSLTPNKSVRKDLREDLVGSHIRIRDVRARIEIPGWQTRQQA
jgi:hypothetical protein